MDQHSSFVILMVFMIFSTFPLDNPMREYLIVMQNILRTFA